MHPPLRFARESTPWQRVEAFRTLLKTSKRALSGLLPPNRTGLLDIEKLLKTPLPAAADLG